MATAGDTDPPELFDELREKVAAAAGEAVKWKTTQITA